MLEHHRATIERANATIAARDETLAVLVGGSIAHGFETPASDVDVMIVVSDDVGFADWPGRDMNWGARFAFDTELAWMDGKAAISDL